MGIKDKVKRASKIFSSDSKDDLPVEVVPDVAPETETEVEAVEADAEVAPEAEVEPVVAEVEPTVEAAEVKPEEIVEAEPEVAAEEIKTDEVKGEEAKTEVAASSGTEKAVKKNDIFKRILLKFKKSTSSATKSN